MPSAFRATDPCVLSRGVLCIVIELKESCPCQVISVPIDEGVFDVLVEIVNAHKELAIVQYDLSSLLPQSWGPEGASVAPITPERLISPRIPHLDKLDGFAIEI